MVEDADAMWKPGYAAPTSDDATAEVADEPAAGRSELPDGFHPAAGPRRPQRVAPAGAPPAAAARTATVGAARPAAAEIVATGWAVERDDDGARTRPPAVGGRLRRLGLGVAAFAALVVAAMTVVMLLDDERSPQRPEPGELSAADERRLPAEVGELWATTLSGSGNALASSMIVDGRDLVVAVVDDGSRNRSMIVGVDATSGEQRWRRSFSFAPPEMSLVGVIDGVVLVEQSDLSSRTLIGLAAVDGATLWDTKTADGGVNVLLLGTELVAHVSSTVDGMITFVDPLTGEAVGGVVGELVSTDLAGTWYVAQGDSIVSIDLADGWSEPVDVATGVVALGEQSAVVDGRLLVVDPDGGISEVTPAEPRGVRLRGGDLPRIDSMFPAGGSSFVGLNNGEVFGIELVGDAVTTTWKRTASLRSFAVTERGLVLALSDAGAGFVDGVDLIVVDGVTGDRLAGAGAVNDLDALPLIVGDGFVTVTSSVDGVERIGYDLEGREIWRLPVSGKLRVGDELIVVLANTPAGYELRAYGAST